MMALIDEMSNPKRPPPMTEMAAMRYTLPNYFIATMICKQHDLVESNS